MSNQQQDTAEKSVQTQDSAGATGLVSSNPENTAAEVANTLVSMATGRERGIATVKQLNVINVPNPSAATSSLPIISLADFTTARGVPTATALANQAKLTPLKQDSILESNDDDTSMASDGYNQVDNNGSSSVKSRRGKANKSMSHSKSGKQQLVEPIQYGPISVKPRKQIAPTLANGRKSKDEPLPPEESRRRQERRDRNKQAAAKCRKKRNELREQLEKTEQILLEQQQNLQHSVQSLAGQKNHLELLLHRHACLKKPHLSMANSVNISKTEVKTIPATTMSDPHNSKRVTINLSNAHDLFAGSSLVRATSSTDASSSTSSGGVPMITIHILPEVAQALLGSTSVDRAKLVELLQQANASNSSSAAEAMLTNNTS